MQLVRLLLAGISVICCSAGSVLADPLVEWEPWVAEKHPDIDCPWQASQPPAHVCIWPGELSLSQHALGLRFSYRVTTFREDAFVALPGSPKAWPFSTTINGKSVAVIDRSGTPVVRLPEGQHLIEGEFRWRQRPGALVIPQDIALVSLEESGNHLPVVRNGRQLVLSQTGQQKKARQKDSLRIEVFRKIIDGVPLTLETQVILSASGQSREIQIGQAQWQEMELQSFASPLPARLEHNGDLRVQLVAGRHELRLVSRFLGQPSAITPNSTHKAWPDEEYVSFQADTSVRQARISGAPSIDTSQIPMPDQWRQLPTYRINGNTELLIETEFRGDDSPAANHLAVDRNLWLDFDGGGITGLESITGSMRQGWRLNAAPGVEIGRARASGRPVLITESDGLQGVEIRSPEIALSAVTRSPDPGDLPAVGWTAKADSFHSRLHTPPGWRVLHASGVDEVRGTWISQWDLWDIFLLLIIIAATKKVAGLRAAALAAIALLVTYHEPGSPVSMVVVVLLILPLARVLKGGIRTTVLRMGWVASAFLALILIAYAVSSFRVAIYPSLEQGSVGRYNQNFSAYSAGPHDKATDSIVMEGAQELEEAAAAAAESSRVRMAKAPTKKFAAAVNQTDMYSLGEHDRVQTGPGAPVWTWNVIQLGATMPVSQEQRISVVYSSPLITAIWRISSVFLIGAYAALLISLLARAGRKDDSGPTPGAAAGQALCLVLAAGLLAPADVSASQYPSKYLLDELERRFTAPPKCLPSCASLNHGRIEATPSSLVIQFEASVLENLHLPLPTPREGLQVTRVSVNDGTAPALRSTGGTLAVQLAPGQHEVRVEASFLGDAASLNMAMPIHNLSAQAEGWTITGLVDGRSPSGTLTFQSTARSAGEEEGTLIPSPIAPFVLVHRQLSAGAIWSMRTTVERIAPASGPLSVSVPILEFEEPLTSAINIKNGKAHIQLQANQGSISWESAIEPVSELLLKAEPSEYYLQTWRVIPSALWRLSHDGIPPIREPGLESTLRPFWRPWPGEELRLQFERPTGIVGPTYTVEEANFEYRAGDSLQHGTLTLRILASIGQDYALALPEGAEVLSVMRDGVELNRPEANTAKIALRPGEQTVTVNFQQRVEAGVLHRSPQIVLPGGGSNISIAYTLPQDRWPLHLSGPPIGPAMLYWGMFIVIIMGAFLLRWLASRLELDIPVGISGWLLLGIGLSTVNSYGVLIVATFFFAMAYRQKLDYRAYSNTAFNFIQFGLALLTVAAVASLIFAIPQGLLSNPNMMVTGNNSWSHHYNYFQDRAAESAFPQVTVISVGLIVYRITMLLWSLWLANRLLSWASWWWAGYSEGRAWVPRIRKDSSRDDQSENIQ